MSCGLQCKHIAELQEAKETIQLYNVKNLKLQTEAQLRPVPYKMLSEVFRNHHNKYGMKHKMVVQINIGRNNLIMKT